MKSLFISIAGVFSLISFLSVHADDHAHSKDKARSRVIVVEDKPGTVLNSAPDLRVETGNDDVSGSPEGNIKAAYRSWDQKCAEWKKELKHLNAKNLLFASCGKPTRSVESLQSEKNYTYSSKGTYKIKVVGK